jgi:hypothetical protein
VVSRACFDPPWTICSFRCWIPKDWECIWFVLVVIIILVEARLGMCLPFWLLILLESYGLVIALSRFLQIRFGWSIFQLISQISLFCLSPCDSYILWVCRTEPLNYHFLAEHSIWWFIVVEFSLLACWICLLQVTMPTLYGWSTHIDLVTPLFFFQ